MGIMEDVESMEINEGKNVTEVLAAVSEGSNEVGVVYATDAASVAGQVEIIAEAPAEALKRRCFIRWALLRMRKRLRRSSRRGSVPCLSAV